MNNSSENADKNKKKKTVFAVTAAAVAVILIGIVSYQVLSKVKAQQQLSESSQEQFVGTVQVSEQLQDECQKSAEKIIDLVDKQNVTKMFAEYRQHAENCREVYFSVDTKSVFRSEGNYPDLIVDMAMLAAKTDKALAAEMLNFAKSMGAWEFYMGPVVCSSNATIDAYLESLSLNHEKVCYNSVSDKEKLLAEIKNKNFSVFSNIISNEVVVFVGSLESDAACAEKISTAIKIAQNATAGNLTLEEEKNSNTGNGILRLVFKAKDEVKLALEFLSEDNCLKLSSVLIPEQQVNE